MERGRPSKFRTQNLALHLDAGYGMTLIDNPILDPNDFTTANWDKRRCSATADQTTDPFGGSAADKITEDNTNNTHLVVQSVTNTITNLPVTISVYAKAGSRSWIVLGDAGGGGNSGVWFDLTNGVIGSIQGSVTGYSMTSAGNGWYLCSAKVVLANGAYSCFMTTGDGVQVYTGDGSSFLYFYGAKQTQPKASGWNMKGNRLTTFSSANTQRALHTQQSVNLRLRPATVNWLDGNAPRLDNTTDNVLPINSPRTILSVGRILSSSVGNQCGGTIIDFRRISHDSVISFMDLKDAINTYLYSDGLTSNIALTGLQPPSSTIQNKNFVMTHLITAVSASMQFRLNGVGRTDFVGGNFVGEDAATGFSIGARISYNQAWNGELAEIVVLGRVPWRSVYHRIERYLNAKYAIKKLI